MPRRLRKGRVSQRLSGGFHWSVVLGDSWNMLFGSGTFITWHHGLNIDGVFVSRAHVVLAHGCL